MFAWFKSHDSLNRITNSNEMGKFWVLSSWFKQFPYLTRVVPTTLDSNQKSVFTHFWCFISSTYINHLCHFSKSDEHDTLTLRVFQDWVFSFKLHQFKIFVCITIHLQPLARLTWFGCFSILRECDIYHKWCSFIINVCEVLSCLSIFIPCGVNVNWQSNQSKKKQFL